MFDVNINAIENSTLVRTATNFVWANQRQGKRISHWRHDRICMSNSFPYKWNKVKEKMASMFCMYKVSSHQKIMLMYKSLKKSYHCYNVSNIQCQHNCKNLSVCYNNNKKDTRTLLIIARKPFSGFQNDWPFWKCEKKRCQIKRSNVNVSDRKSKSYQGVKLSSVFLSL